MPQSVKLQFDLDSHQALNALKDENISFNGYIGNLGLQIYQDILVDILTQNIDRPKNDQNSWKYKKKLLEMKLEV